MDLALSSVLVFLIVVPGLVARRCYFHLSLLNQVRQREFVNELFWSIVPGLVLHFIWILLVEWVTPFVVGVPEIAFLLAGSEDNERLDAIARVIHENIGWVILYYIFLVLFAMLIGFGIKELVIRCKLDARFTFSDSESLVLYIIGQNIETDDSPSDFDELSIILVDVLCNVGEEKIIYIGELLEFYLNSDGELDSLLLRWPHRRYLKEDKQDPDKYYAIPSDLLLLPYRDVININVRYTDRE